MADEAVLYSVSGGVATLEINRPRSANALEADVVSSLMAGLDRAEGDPGVRALVLTGSGKAFCAGGDLKAMAAGFASGEGKRYVNKVQGLVERIMRLEKPVVAAVNGSAFGAGFNLALACDLVIAAEESRFSQAYVRVGLVPDLGAFYLLPRLVGLLRAKELCLTGRILSATEAAGLGLVNQVVPVDQLRETAQRLAEGLAEGPATALGFMKSIFNRSFEASLQDLLEAEAYAQDVCFGTAEHKEGVRAFLEKRPPRFWSKEVQQ